MIPNLPISIGIGGGSEQRDTPFNINTIKSAITARNGVSRTSHFRVLITRPRWLIGAEMDDFDSFGEKSFDETEDTPPFSIIDDIPMICDSAVLPGVNFTTSEIRNMGYGPLERRPDVPMYTELPLTFLSTGDGEVFKFFHRWMQNVINIGTGDKSFDSTQYNGSFMYETMYPSNYRTNIIVYHYNEVAEQLMTYQFYDAYPVGLGDVPMSWSSTDEIVRLPVQFAYTYWHSDTFEVGQIASKRGSGTSVLQKLTSIGSAVATIQNLRKPTSVMDAFHQLGSVKTVGNIVGGLF